MPDRDAGEPFHQIGARAPRNDNAGISISDGTQQAARSRAHRRAVGIRGDRGQRSVVIERDEDIRRGEGGQDGDVTLRQNVPHRLILTRRCVKGGGEGGIRTPVPVTRQDAFEAPPLRPLRYISLTLLGGARLTFPTRSLTAAPGKTPESYPGTRLRARRQSRSSDGSAPGARAPASPTRLHRPSA